MRTEIMISFRARSIFIILLLVCCTHEFVMGKSDSMPSSLKTKTKPPLDEPQSRKLYYYYYDDDSYYYDDDSYYYYDDDWYYYGYGGDDATSSPTSQPTPEPTTTTWAPTTPFMTFDVSSQAELSSSIQSRSKINLVSDISMSSYSVNYVNDINLLFINGDGFGIGGYYKTYQCFDISNSIVQMSNLSIHDCASAFRLSNAELTLINCDLYDNSYSNGGAMYLTSSSTAILNNCRLHDNYGYYNGGIYLDASKATLSNCQVFDNEGYYYSGGFHLNAGSELDITNSDVYGQHNQYYGGAFYSNGGTISMTSCLVYNNDANYGGVFYLSQTTLNVADSDIHDNEAVYYGGVFYGSNSDVTVTNTEFHNHKAQYYGGLVYLSYLCNLVMTNCGVYFSNVEYYYGGALYLDYKVVTVLNNCIFGNNSAVWEGGAIAVEYQSDITATNCDFYYNSVSTSKGDGGAVILYSQCEGVFIDCEFIFNSADFGGAIYAYWKSPLELVNCLVARNDATKGGGIMADSSGTNLVDFTILNSVLYHNVADDGGAIYSDFYYLSANNCSIIQNHATTSSGGVYVNYGTATINNTMIHNNTATEDSGGVSFFATSGIVKTTNFSFNTGYLGGGMYIEDSTYRLLDNIFAYNTALQGGGFYLLSGEVSQAASSFEGNYVTGFSFEIQSGNCTAVGSCFYSPNYPSNYNSEDTCEIVVVGDGDLEVNKFVTNADDYLTVDGTRYSETTGPEGVTVATGDVLTWASNKSTNVGFDICFALTPDGGGFYVADGEMSGFKLSLKDNVADNGGGFYLAGGTNYIQVGNMKDNYATLAGDSIYASGGSFEAVSLVIDGFDSSDFSGSISNSLDCLSTCSPGEAGVCDSDSTNAPNCYVNCACEGCIAGTASDVTFSVDSDDCIDCASGYFSAEGASTCDACDPGKFASDNASSTDGGLTNPVASAAISCNDCPVGYIADDFATFVCEACAAGKSNSKEGRTNCTLCPVGTISVSGASSCTDCPVETFSDYTGAQVCQDCSFSKTSSPGSTWCDQSVPDYFLLNNEPEECPVGAICPGGYYYPIPQPSHWIDRSSPEYFTHAYRCSRDTCKGSNNNTCWTQEVVDSNETFKECKSEDLMCTEGAYGHLCGACKLGYSFNTNLLICVECDNDPTLGYIALGLMGLAIIVAIAMRLGGKLEIPTCVWDSWVMMIGRHSYRTGSFKVLLSTYQIIQSVTYAMEVVYPKMFSITLRFLTFLSFEMPGLECNGVGVYARVYFASAVPFITAITIHLAGDARVYYHKKFSTDSPKEIKKECNNIKSLHAWALLFLSYLVLPPVTGKQLAALDCYPFPETSGYRGLRMDTSIDCDAKAHRVFVLINVFLILIYLSIPFLWLVMLYKQRRALFPVGILDDAIIRQRRKSEESLNELKFLFERYRAYMVGFESVDMFRRILFVGVVPLMATTSLMRSAIGVMFALFFMVLNRELVPYTSAETNVVSYIADIVIYLTFASALMIETGLTAGLDTFIFGLILCIVNFTVVSTAILASIYRTKYERDIRHKIREKTVRRVDFATDYSSTQFEDIFEEIRQTDLAPTHCIVHYFGSLVEIDKLLRHGIPVEKGMPGIVFTMHHPYDLTELEKRHFKMTEAFVTCALPQRLLQPVSAYEGSRSALWMLPKSIILAMRGVYFASLADAEPWEDDMLLLPPQCIKRAYQIVDDPVHEIVRETFSIGCCGVELCGSKKKILPLTTAQLYMISKQMTQVEEEIPPTILQFPLIQSNVRKYLQGMEKIRTYCNELGLVPVYHYTTLRCAELIHNGGLAMKIVDGLEGGVHLTTYGPSSYQVGSPIYEQNIIVDFYGRDNYNTFKELELFEVCIVYAIDPYMLEYVSDNKYHLVHIPKVYFADLSIAHPDGRYFLHHDRVVGGFYLRAQDRFNGLLELRNELNEQTRLDLETREIIKKIMEKKNNNETIMKAVMTEVVHCQTIEWAVTFTNEKYTSIFSTMSSVGVPISHSLYFYYGSLAEIEKYVTYGIPIKKNVGNGNLVFTTHQPDMLTKDEIKMFLNSEAFIVCSLPKKLLIPLTKLGDGSTPFSEDTRLFSLPTTVLRAMRGTYFKNLVDSKPWKDGALLLPPGCFKAVFQTVDDADIINRVVPVISPMTHVMDQLSLNENKDDLFSNKGGLKSGGGGAPKLDSIAAPKTGLGNDNDVMKPIVPKLEIMKVTTHLQYGKIMDEALHRCKQMRLEPVFYYTNQSNAKLIIENGFKMKNSNPGGVCFGLLEPSSFGLWTPLYETNLLTAFMDKEKLIDYQDKKLVEVCFIYAIESLVVEHMQGDASRVYVPKTYFQDFGLLNRDGRQFLRPDRILGVYLFEQINSVLLQKEDSPTPPTNAMELRSLSQMKKQGTVDYGPPFDSDSPTDVELNLEDAVEFEMM